MNTSKITEKDFWIAAESWYQRTHKLREIAETETDPRRKSKATKLFLIMVDRVLAASRHASKISSRRHPKFPIGGVYSNGPEKIIK